MGLRSAMLVLAGRLSRCGNAILFTCAVGLTGLSPAAAQMVTVNANSNIFGAGHATVVGPGGGGAGVLPPEYDFGFTAGPNTVLTFSNVIGTAIVNAGTGDNINDPDGIGAGSPDLSVNSLNGISGILGPHAGFLVGVFENDIEPTDPPPARLDFTLIGTNFASLAPSLNQVFFIGDGLTGDGAGTAQQFQIPIGATRIFFGIADAPAYHGDPGGYNDNTGQFSASFAIVPEPSSLALIVAGVAGGAAYARGIRRTGRNKA